MPLSMLIPFRRSRGAVPVGREPMTYGALFGDMDRVLDALWRGAGVAPSTLGDEGFAPRIDVSETDREYRVSAELAGLEEKDFDVSVDDDILTLKGEKRSSSEDEEDGYRYAERVHGRFERALRIPGEFLADEVKATYRNGVLTVTLPKPPEAQAKSRVIPITSD